MVKAPVVAALAMALPENEAIMPEAITEALAGPPRRRPAKA